MAVALDSDAVIGFLDRGDALHASAEERLKELLSAGELLVTSAITYAEVLTGAKIGRQPEETVRGFFGDLITDILPVDLAGAERAAELRSQNRALRMPDALILAAADINPDVHLLLGGDRRALRVRGLSCELELLRG